MNMSKFEYADDAALHGRRRRGERKKTASQRYIAVGQRWRSRRRRARPCIIHPTTRVNATKEAEIVAHELEHVDPLCDSCYRTFPTLKGPGSTSCVGVMAAWHKNARVEGQETRCIGSAKPGARWQYCPRERALFRVFGAKLQCDGSFNAWR